MLHVQDKRVNTEHEAPTAVDRYKRNSYMDRDKSGYACYFGKSSTIVNRLFLQTIS